MQYTEEHYAEMYNNLPEGLKDLVLSGRLAILVAAIGSRHGLNPDQVADLEPAIEDVCLGLITKQELVDNIIKSTNVDQRVANRIAAEAELEILNPFDAELVIARKQKEDLDAKINKISPKSTAAKTQEVKNTNISEVGDEPKDVSGHAQIKKVSDWHSKDEENKKEEARAPQAKTSFDWDKDFASKKVEEEKIEKNTINNEQAKIPTNLAPGTLETKLDVLTESINKLVNVRFGNGEVEDKKSGVSQQMQELVKRLEKAEKENEENKKIIKSLQGVKPVESIFGTQTIQKQDTEISNPSLTKIQIDKERKVEINHKEIDETKEVNKKENLSGNVLVTSVSQSIPIISSTVSKDTLDSIVETRNKPEISISSAIPETSKKVLSLEELINKSDDKIKNLTTQPKTATLIFPGLNDEKRIDIKNISQVGSLRQTLVEDLEFLKKDAEKVKAMDITQHENLEKNEPVKSVENLEKDPSGKEKGNDMLDQDKQTNDQNIATTSTYSTNPFKEELLPKTKEERMQILQEKIKALNKGVSVGGKTNISASGLDPYRL